MFKANRLSSCRTALKLSLLSVAVTAVLNGNVMADTQKEQLKPQKVAIGATESIDKYIENTKEESLQVVTHPGASYMKLHIAELSLGQGDYITISDAEGNETYRYPGDASTGNANDGFWAISVLGDTAVIRFHDQNGSQAGADGSNYIVVDKYNYGLTTSELEENEPPMMESICGAEDHRNAVCFSSSHPTEFQNSSATARVIYSENGGTYTCTGWRVGPNPDTLITNEHCLNNQAAVDTAEIWFNYQHSDCNGNDNPRSGRVVVTGNRLLEVSRNYDMALITLNNADRISQFGSYELDNRAPVRGEAIYIPQHPGGVPKRLSITSDQNGGGRCQVDEASVAGRVSGSDMGYYCDTEGGSSGSPVIAASSNKVIALHHFGGCTNQGVRVDRFYNLVAPHLNSDGGGDGGDGGNSGNVLASANFNDQSMGDFRQISNDSHNFTITSGGTPSNGTGPSNAAEGSHYIYLETSRGDANRQGNNAIIRSRQPFSGSDLGIDFRYHMLGDAVGTLRVQVSENGQAWQTVWSQNGSQGNSWQQASVDLSRYTNEVSIRLEAEAAGGWQGDIAIDDIQVTGNAGSSTSNPGSSNPGASNPGSSNPGSSGGNSGGNTGSSGQAFGLESDGTVYHQITGHTANWVYLCLNDYCLSPSDNSNGRWSHQFNLDGSGSYKITAKIQDNAKGQCITEANSVSAGSSATSTCQ